MNMPNYPPPPGWPPPPQQLPPKNTISYGRAWAMAGIFFVGDLIFGAPIGTGGSSDTSSASASPRQTVSRAAPTTSVVTSTAPAGPRTSFADGVWEVGVDVKPGKYKASGTSDGSCYHAHLSGTTGSLDDIIGNHRGAGPQTVVIEEGQYFESDDCGTWTLQ